MRLRSCRIGLVALGAALLALGVASCADRLPDTAGPHRLSDLRLVLRTDALSTSGDAFARVDAAHVTVKQAAATLLDTVAAFAASGETGLALAVLLPDPTGTVTVAVELLAGGQVVFRGEGSAQVERGSTVSVPITIAPVVGGIAAPDSVTLTAVGDTVRLRAAIVFATRDTLSGISAMTWRADTAGVISVTPDGLVTSLSEGNGLAIASYQTFSDTTSVRVHATIAQVKVSVDTLSLFVDSTRTLSARVLDRNGHALQRTVAWSSSSTAVATVDGKGTVKAIAPGTATITAAMAGRSDSAVVTVRRVPVGVVQLSLPSAEVVVGGAVPFTALTLDITGLAVTDRSILWSTSDSAVATVDTAGLVRAVAVGRAIISATSEGQRDTAVISVVQPTVGLSSGQVKFVVLPGSGSFTRSVSITNTGTGMLVGLSATVSYGQSTATGWLTASLSRDTAPATLTLAADPDTLPVGTYTATVSVASAVPGAGTADVAVALAVRQPLVGVSRNSIPLQASWVGGGSDTLTVLNVGSGSLTNVVANVAYAASEPSGWLSLSPSSWQTVPAGGTTMTLTGTAHVPGAQAPLPPGTYHATVTLSSDVPHAGTAQVAVTLSVIQPLVSVSAGTVSTYTVRAGAGTRTSVAVSNAGNGSLDGLSATVAYTPGQPTGWLTSAALAAATAPTALWLTADPTSLPVGTYTATVTVASTVPGAGTADVAVTFDVLEPLPAADVTYGTLHSTVRFWNVAIASVSAGTISGNTASVRPGATIRVTGNWQIGPVTDVSYCPGCIIQVYVAWLNPARAAGVDTLHLNKGLWSGMLPVLNPNPGASGLIDFTTVAPTVSGDYYIGQGGSLDFHFVNTVLGGPGWVTGGSPPNRWVSFRIHVQ